MSSVSCQLLVVFPFLPRSHAALSRGYEAIITDAIPKKTGLIKSLLLMVMTGAGRSLLKELFKQPSSFKLTNQMDDEKCKMLLIGQYVSLTALFLGIQANTDLCS